MRKVLSYFFAILAALFAAAAVAAVHIFPGQIPVLIHTPAEARVQVEALMDAVCSGDFQEAESMLYGSASLGLDREPEDKAGQMIWNTYVASLDYELVGQLYATDTGPAQDVKIISLELPSVTRNLRTRAQTLLNEAVAAAEDVSQLYDENNAYREDLVMEILHRAVEDALVEDARYTYQMVTLRLTYSDDRWLILPDQSFLNAVSGGITG